MKHSLRTIMFVPVMLLIMAGCRKTTQYEQYGWIINADPATSTLSIAVDGLDEIATQVRLNLKDGNEMIPLSDWSLTEENGELVIDTEKPEETEWKFIISESGINVFCSADNGIITGTAPAGEKRIPARIAQQDNGIMYTQMGFVSATNIYNLFDMETDIMIRFTRGSKLSRNKDDHTLMDIQVPVTDHKEFIVARDYYTRVIGLADNQQTEFKPVYKPIPERFETAPTGWSSWYCYYMAPTQEDLVSETDALAEKLKAYGLEYVQLDAAFTRGEQANWLEWNKEMYPDGGKWWFSHIREKGLKPGLWINVYGDNYANPSMSDKYPEEFFLRDSLGNLSGACCTADKTVVRLDYTNPEVIEKHLTPLFQTLVNEWGLDYLKDAGWGTWMNYYEENRENAFNPDMDSREAYRNAQAAIREAMGDDNYIVGCAMHEIGVGFGFFDGSRTGGDDYAQWTGEGHFTDGMQTYFNSLFGANWLNGICWWSDPDDVMIRDPLTMDEAKTIVSSISLSGQAYIISDFIADFSRERLQNFLHSDYHIGWASRYPEKVKALPGDKLELYRKTMPTMPIRAMDLYPFKAKAACCPKPEEYPRALDLKVNAASGMYDVVALYNWEGKTAEKTLDLQEDLGLEAGNDYLVYDYWDNWLLGVSNGKIQEEVPAHGTKALIIKKAADIPQLLATSRHLTAAYSIREINWNGEEKSLAGVSETVPGDRYALFIHVPDNYEFAGAESTAGEVTHGINADGTLEVAFTGTEAPAEWKIVFK